MPRSGSPLPRLALVALLWASALALLGLVCGCGLEVLPTTVPIPSDTPTSALTATVMPSPTATLIITETGPITLTIWYPEHLAPSSGQPGGEVLQAQYEAFQETYPRLRIEGVRIKPYGPGGLLDYLRTTSKILPGELPDLVALDMKEVPEAAELGVLQPMDDLLPGELVEDLFPFADKAGLYDGERLAVPYEVDARFLAYNRTMVDPVPVTWVNVYTSSAKYLLPLGAGNVGNVDALLLQYSALDGPLQSQEWQLTLDEAKLADVLDFYKQGLNQGVIHTATLTTTNLSECWSIYIAGDVAMTEASARQYLSDRARLTNTRYAGIPTKEGALATVTHGWAWCLVAPDLQRQQGAIALLLWLMEKDNLAARCKASLYLPTRRGAMKSSLGDAESADFFNALLEHAYLRPPSRDYPTVAGLMYTALQDVLTGSAAPEQAAREVGAYIERLRTGQPGGGG